VIDMLAQIKSPTKSELVKFSLPIVNRNLSREKFKN